MAVLKIKTENGIWQEVWGGTLSGAVANAPKLTSITMLANEWASNGNLYHQTVVCNGVNVNSKLDLQPSPAQIVALQDEEISLMASNNNGVVTIWSIGGKLNVDMTMDVLNIAVENGTGVIYGNLVGGASPLKTLKLVDENNTEIIGVVVDEEVVLTATDNDVLEGKVYAGDKGISTGTLQI